MIINPTGEEIQLGLLTLAGYISANEEPSFKMVS